MNSGDIAGLVIGSVLVMSIAVTVILRGPLGSALSRRIEGTGGGVEDRVHYLEQRVTDLEQAQARIPELEERVDFAERLLTRGESPDRQPAGEERR
jgi:hypothetical protein